MTTVYNFSAGPSALPKDVLKKAQEELVNYKNSGMSVMELSHRSGLFSEIMDDAEALIRELMEIPDNYKVLFLQGGASTQFAMAPMNLLTGSKKADYVITGSWSQKAYQEAQKYGDIRLIGDSEGEVLSHIPKITKDQVDPEADYVHITTNNTIEGTTFHDIPDTGDVPIVADMSSNILSRPMDVSQFGLIYAGAQKNIGPAGLTLVIVRDDLIGHAPDWVPTMLDYKIHAEKKSVYNTPPAFSIYMAKLVFEWLRDEVGGLYEMEKRNQQKAELLYQTIEQSALFKTTVEKEDRSWMNVPFVSVDDDKELEATFIKEAKEEGLETLKGHRSVGGMRASIYNAMPYEGVKKLAEFIEAFEKKHRG
ncbi:phosphoserine aminotransferase apoenzyme [Pelagirhabdus alkalitolerans]|uniref:Phosphoserine aminotransferase n=1 Tax=Pelagirhabdus alkalitolerans TaxID=1612202 RepID=A0A1G6GNP6_9BACI|nr:3-phosphoserine/phosphohydroxythreonine transaminase [Pelagirhabdus alkalitolerans]SDB82816.1 phosphoserine aminotransferase apoenzyme [Pelagirhabdus alkalitolerans]